MNFTCALNITVNTTLNIPSEPAIICLKLTIETIEQGVKYVNKLTRKTTEGRHWRCSGFFTVNFGHISKLVLVFLFLALSSRMPAWFEHFFGLNANFK